MAPRQNNARAQQLNRAGLAIQFGDGSVTTRCVNFSEDHISGYELLVRSKLNVIADVSGSGAFVCKIEADGCNFPTQACGCMFNSEQRFWGYWLFQSGEWHFSYAGASDTSVVNDSVQGWTWGANKDPLGTLPMLSAQQICGPPTATATPIPVPPTATLDATAQSILIGGQTPTPIPVPSVAIPASATPELQATAPGGQATIAPPTLAPPTAAPPAPAQPATQSQPAATLPAVILPATPLPATETAGQGPRRAASQTPMTVPEAPAAQFTPTTLGVANYPPLVTPTAAVVAVLSPPTAIPTVNAATAAQPAARPSATVANTAPAQNPADAGLAVLLGYIALSLLLLLLTGAVLLLRARG